MPVENIKDTNLDQDENFPHICRKQSEKRTCPIRTAYPWNPLSALAHGCLSILYLRTDSDYPRRVYTPASGHSVGKDNLIPPSINLTESHISLPPASPPRKKKFYMGEAKSTDSPTMPRKHGYTMVSASQPQPFNFDILYMSF